MFIQKLTEQEIEQLVKIIIKSETGAKYVVKNQVDLTLSELGIATGIRETETVFAYNGIVIKNNKVCKNITINGWTVYKQTFDFSSEFGKNHGERTYTISDFEISATNENLSFKQTSEEELVSVYRKFMFSKFGQEYVDAYSKYRKAELRKSNKFYNNETQKNVEDMTK